MNSQDSQGEKTENHKGKLIRLWTYFLLAETLQVRRQWNVIFKILKDGNHQPRIIHPANLSFRCEGGIRAFTDKQKLREFTTRCAFQEMLKRLFLHELKRQNYTKVWISWPTYRQMQEIATLFQNSVKRLIKVPSFKKN